MLVAGFGVLVPKAFLFPKQHRSFFDAQNYDLGGLVLAFWHLGGSLWHLGGHPGRSWEQQEGHVGVWNRNFVDLKMIWDPKIESFLGTEG